MTKLNFCSLLLACFCCCLPGRAMDAPPAPFANKEKAAEITVKPKIEKRGFAFGNKRLIMTEQGNLILQSGGTQIFDIYTSFGAAVAPWMPVQSVKFKNRQFKADKANRSFSYEADVPLVKKEDGDIVYSHYRMDMILLADDRIKLDVVLEAPKAYQKYLRDTVLNFEGGMPLFRGNQFRVNEKSGTFTGPEEKTPVEKEPKNKYPRRELFNGTFDRLDIAGDDVDKAVSFTGNARLSFLECWHLDRKPFLWLRFVVPDRKKQRMSIILDMRRISEAALQQSDDTHAGIDFWQNDRLKMPDYSAKNLVQNPSFESGLRYYTCFLNNADHRSRFYDNMYSTDSQTAHSGRQSLKLRAIKALGYHPASLNTMAIPIKEGQTYTVSCYAKGNYDQGLSLRLSFLSAKWPLMSGLGNHRLNKEWQRFSYTFKAPNNALKLELRALYTGHDPSGEGIVWVDDLQLEEGDKATAFAGRPFEAELCSSNDENFLSPQEDPDLKLKIYAKAGTRGNVTLKLIDFFDKTIWQKCYEFTIDAARIAVIPLEISKLPRGVMVMEGEFKLADGTAGREWFRLAVMDKLANKHRWKNICATGIQINNPLFEKQLARYRDIGFGSTTYISDDKDVFEKIQVYGMDTFTKEVFHEARHGGSITVDGKVLVRDVRYISSVSPELEKQVEEASYQKAKSMPWITNWCFCRENRIIFSNLLPGNVKDFAKLLVACYKGIKRFNPDAIITVDGGPNNMMPGGGIQELESYIQHTINEVEFDGTAIHPYRASAEEPDLDSDGRQFFAMLAKYGLENKPIYWNEGIYYSYYTIPEWGLSVAAGYDHWRVGAPTYHMGWSERVCAAHYARSWLVAYKYQDKIKQFNGWSYWTCLDIYQAPFALQKIPNTLGRLLGNAQFKEDIRFAPKVRCYLFEDDQKRPVAAVWCHRTALDLGLERCPDALFDFGGDEPELFDLMEVPQKFTKKGNYSRMPVSNFPVFLRGRPGTLEQMAKAIRNGSISGDDVAPVTVNVKPINAKQLEVSCLNLLSRPFKGGLKIGAEEDMKTCPLDIPGNATHQLIVSAPVQLGYDKLEDIKIPVCLILPDKKEIKINADFRGFAVKEAKTPMTIDGNLEDWQNVPPIRITNKLVRKPQYVQDTEKGGYSGDLDAAYRIAWDRRYLYVAVQVTDDKLLNDVKRAPGGRWYGDCIQFYLDTQGDARKRTTKGFDANDYNYDFLPNFDSNTVTVFRRFAPEQQQAGGLYAPKANEIAKEVKSALKKTADGYVVEVALPAWSVVPFFLKKGNVAGVSFIVNDLDQKVLKDSLMTTPGKIEPYNNPHVYPLMLLAE